MNTTPRSERLHIAIFGKRNAGKSSLINAITNQPIAIVSDMPGTTTDPVYKSMEILPLGPVVLIDTAGIDDEGILGKLRVEKTLEVLNKTDIAILVVSDIDDLTYEKQLAKLFDEKKVPRIGVLNKIDKDPNYKETLSFLQSSLGMPFLAVSCATLKGIEELKSSLAKLVPDVGEDLRIVGDLINPGDFVVLVVPIDKAAPKGRLILPQQQTIRDILDSDAIAIVTKEYELKETIENLGKKPAIVITDSQAFLKVDADTPPDVPLTSFSILFARYKGDLVEFVEGVRKIKDLKPGDTVLIAEACTHHRQSDDIGTVKIPRWLRQIAGFDINFEWVSGYNYPKDLSKYALIIHCGGCMITRREMLFRIELAKQQGVPITNYGIMIAYVHGILPRALKPFGIEFEY
ncbi:[FeFe] hydrogenase H-cluster maturation GTPase HydF [Caldicellulosiruptor changbaiensis]|uniref:[FeFe] hydrogenase H-cluster maturation GTPase HydF n=1 Tax=Caldicellulosiruptor changbaiensis TaxID=1222016 RepID=A0A3T0D996_9FIRM|nr:[FeFe] hydrogenase H-cluster maturation GTPase HydF [Caldicellulosiruptor changbaiensis]AZT91614.1 [FeFe] hydrogenase H-cluster maturation GTPase HydF [Caldicellulosiruptor changbaiensis]